MNIRVILFGMAVIIMSSCASSYRQINPHYSDYQSTTNDEVTLNYRYDILKKSDNKKYDKKANQNNIRLVGVEIVNNSKESIQLGKNYGIYSSQSQITLLTPDQSSDKLKQGVGGHIFYMLLTPLKLIITDSNGIAQSYSIGYGLGPGLTLLNMTTAGSANNKMKKELELYNLLNRPIPAGEAVKGIIAFESDDHPALSLKKVEQPSLNN